MIAVIFALAALVSVVFGPWWVTSTYAFGATIWLWRGLKESRSH